MTYSPKRAQAVQKPGAPLARYVFEELGIAAMNEMRLPQSSKRAANGDSLMKVGFVGAIVYKGATETGYRRVKHGLAGRPESSRKWLSPDNFDEEGQHKALSDF